MGGSASEEFLAPSATGEDTFVQCTNCDYAANTEAVEDRRAAGGGPRRTQPPARVLDTPDTPTIDALVAALNELSQDTGLDHGRVFTARRHAEERGPEAAPADQDPRTRWRRSS